jgi:hypothetical protein
MVSPPVYLGIKHPSWAYDQIFITVRQLLVCWCGALALTRGRVRRLQLLLTLASADIFGSDPRGTRDHNLLSQIWNFRTRRVAVEVFGPAYTWESAYLSIPATFWPLRTNLIENNFYAFTTLVGLGRFFSSLIYTQSVGLLWRVISPSQGRCLHTGQHKQNKRAHTSMSWMGFEPTIPAFERPKTVHGLYRGATMIGNREQLEVWN